MLVSAVLQRPPSDIVERFTLSLMLFFVAFRNLIELSGSDFDFSGGFFLPKSFGWSARGGHAGLRILWTISYVRSHTREAMPFTDSTNLETSPS